MVIRLGVNLILIWKILKKTTAQNIAKFIKENPIPSKKQTYIVNCKKCGKQFQVFITPNLFEKGKYTKHCSRSCANSRDWTYQNKLKVSISAKKSQKVKLANNSRMLPIITKTCAFCDKQFLTRNKFKKFCCIKCNNKGHKMYNYSKSMGGYRKGSGVGKSGWYNGIYCDSSWELAYVIYHIDNNLPIIRNKQKRKYIFNNKQCIYIPDFITNDGLVQIKGYVNEKWNAKLKYNQDIKVIGKQQIKFYLQYVVTKYGKDYIKYYQK